MPFVRDTLGRPDPYGGTFGIDWSMPFVPPYVSSLLNVLGTYGIDQSMPKVSQKMVDSLNIVEIKASHWSRASNAGL